jgi:fused signal recognition particle receptor
MFDGLKEKLGRFRENVEEETEADDAEAAEPEPEPEAEPEEPTGEAVGEPPEVEDEPRVDPTPEEAAERTADPEPTETADPAEATPAAEDDAGAVADSEADVGTEPETATEADSEPERASLSGVSGANEGRARKESEGGGFASRARRFATGKTLITEEELDEPLEELELALLQGDVEMSVAGEIVRKLREELVGQERAQVKSGAKVIQEAIGDALRDVISVGQFDFDERVRAAEKPVVIVFTGVNGVGKTTTIAKLSQYFEERGLSTVMANGDTYRAGANEQIREHADRLGTKLISHQQGGDPAAVLYDAVEYAQANDVDVVLGDTAGRLHTSKDLMAQLEKIDRVVDPDMTVFVDEAVAGQDATQRAKQFNDAAEIDGVVLTKADADSQGGAAVSIAHVTGKPILFLGVGQEYDDLERFDPDEIVSRVVGDE